MIVIKSQQTGENEIKFLKGIEKRKEYKYKVCIKSSYT